MGCVGPFENNAIHIDECIAGPLASRWCIKDEENSREGHSDYMIKIEVGVNRTGLNAGLQANGGQFTVRSQFTSGGAETARLSTQAGACPFAPFGWFPYYMERTTKDLPPGDANNDFVFRPNTRSRNFTDTDGILWNLTWIGIHGYFKILVVGDILNVGYNGPITVDPCTPLTWNTVTPHNMRAFFNGVAAGVAVNGDNYIALAMGVPATLSDKTVGQLILAYCFVDEGLKFNDMAVQGTGWAMSSVLQDMINETIGGGLG